MSIRNFIGASSALLLAWLGVTYFHEVPVERYQRQEKPSATASLKSRADGHAEIAMASAETDGR